MKKILSISLVLCLVSCTEKLHLPEQPATKDYISCITVNIPELVLSNASGIIEGDGIYHWSADEKLGLMDSVSINAAFVLRSIYDGQAGTQAEFYGDPLNGTFYAYLPWTPVPVVEETSVQTFHADPYEHFKRNSMLFAKLDGSVADFSYSGGLLALTCSEDLGMVESVKVISGQWSAEITDINRACTQTNPLTIWVKTPCGTYKDFSMTFSTETKRLSMPAPGTFEVKDFTVTDVLAKQQSYYDGVDPFEGEEGSYTDEPKDY